LRTLKTALLAAIPLLLWLDSTAALAADPPLDPGPGPVADGTDNDLRSHPFLSDVKAYVAAPLHWDRPDWLFFGGAVVATAVAHHYDDQVRTHFTTGSYASNLTNPSSNELKDALPGIAAIAATWAYGSLVGDIRGHQEAGEMVESAVLSCSTAFVLRFAIGRERPAETDDSNKWFAGSNSFPSLHATGAFAIGTVLAESGNDEYRAFRRVLGYGLGAFSAFQRLKHNDHWLSDTVAGAAIGVSSARFVMNRRDRRPGAGTFSVIPLDRGMMLTYSVTR
jgi:membrane-associated phospholipid phosphatase